MMNTIKVRDFMATKVATLRPDMGASAALQILIDNHQSGAPVVDDENHLLGILSEADCMASAFSGSYYDQERSPVSEIMSNQELQTVTEETSLVAAAELMLKYKRRMLPVIREGKVVGMITRHHMLRSVLETFNPTH